MKFLRGAGTRGLAGIHFRLVMDCIPILRPLLATPRAEIELYLRELNQPWREDHTNCDTHFTRNRIRHELLPLLERDYNPNLRQLLSETADVALSEEEYWRDYTAALASRWHQKVRRMRLQEDAGSGFLFSGVAVQRRTLKHFLDWHGITVDFHHVEAVRKCALGDGSTVNLPAGWLARRNGEWLELSRSRLQPSNRSRPRATGNTSCPFRVVAIFPKRASLSKPCLSQPRLLPSHRPGPCFAPKTCLATSPFATGCPATGSAPLTPARKRS